ncbi:MAG TPA: rhodanese-like domain-containing protein [Candidatus Dormibacteraeota bacterium]|nr:rhodanese-like domain-containing protein [Candidatus Dormibacteraeota bacterium]
MPKEATREQVQELLARGAQLVDVLPGEEYETQHLPGALSLPIREMTSETVSGLRRDQPIVVYCWDYL